MKAKEYAEQYQKCIVNDGMSYEQAAMDTMAAFFEEAYALLIKRGQSKSATIGVFRELSIKWTALSKLEPDFKPEGFKMFLLDQPELRQYASEL